MIRTYKVRSSFDDGFGNQYGFTAEVEIDGEDAELVDVIFDGEPNQHIQQCIDEQAIAAAWKMDEEREYQDHLEACLGRRRISAADQKYDEMKDEGLL